MTPPGRARRARGLVALACALVLDAASVRAADDIATWMNALRAGGMEPAEAAVAALAKEGEPAVAPLTALLVAGSPLERRRACAALGGMSASVTAAVAPLAAASTDPDVEVRLTAVDGLTRWAATPGGAREALLGRLDDPEISVRLRAASALASSTGMSTERVERVLLACLRHASLAPRVAALGAIARLGDAASAEAVDGVTAAIGDPLAPVRGAAVTALVALRPREAETVDAICPRLGDPDPWVAMGSARALALAEAPSAVCATGFLEGGDRLAVRRAAWLLHARAAREAAAAAALAARAADPDAVVRGYARSASWRARPPAGGTARTTEERP